MFSLWSGIRTRAFTFNAVNWIAELINGLNASDTNKSSPKINTFRRLQNSFKQQNQIIVWAYSGVKYSKWSDKLTTNKAWINVGLHWCTLVTLRSSCTGSIVKSNDIGSLQILLFQYAKLLLAQKFFTPGNWWYIKIKDAIKE